jgi:hypothetical protein
MTIALTRAGMPRSGQMNNRAVAALTAITNITSAIATGRRRFRRRFGELAAVLPAGPGVPLAGGDPSGT